MNYFSFAWIRCLLLGLCLTSCNQDVEFAARDIPDNNYSEDSVKNYSFQAGEIRTESISFEPKKLSFDHSFTLEQAPNGFTKTNQITRPLQMEEFTQGGQGRPQLDDFPLIESGFLDLLIVIDNSSSMEVFQNQLRQRFQNLLSNISNTNWQITVATTSSSCLRSTAEGIKVLTRMDYEQFPDLVHSRFENLIVAGSTGSTVEKGILNATNALIGDCGDPSFRWTREDSQKAVLIVSDEKNCGSASNEGCSGEDHQSADYFLKNAPENTRVYGLLLFQDDFNACPDSGGYDDQYPTEYMRLIQETGGLSGEICQADYSEVLETISSHVSQYIKRKFPLTFKPDPGSLKVYLDDVLLDEGYILSGQELRLMITPSMENSMLYVDYTYGKQSMRHYFDLSRNVDEDTLNVKVNGVEKSLDDFYIMEGKTVVFNSVPEASSKIQFNYKEDGVLESKFKLTWPRDASVQGLYLDGVEVDADINLIAQTVTFDNPPSDGSEISIEYQEVNSKILEYPVPQYQNRRVQGLRIVDSITGEEVPYTISGNYIRFTPDQVWLGRQLSAQIRFFPDDDDDFFQFSVPSSLIEGSMVVTTLEGEDCQENVMIDNDTVSLECSKSIDDGLSVSYQYIEGYTNKFLIEEDDDGRSLWRVYVNGQRVETFTRENGVLILNEKFLEPASSVSIEVIPPVRP